MCDDARHVTMLLVWYFVVQAHTAVSCLFFPCMVVHASCGLQPQQGYTICCASRSVASMHWLCNTYNARALSVRIICVVCFASLLGIASMAPWMPVLCSMCQLHRPSYAAAPQHIAHNKVAAAFDNCLIVNLACSDCNGVCWMHCTAQHLDSKQGAVKFCCLHATVDAQRCKWHLGDLGQAPLIRLHAVLWQACSS
jgi:hypothetical protein